MTNGEYNLLKEIHLTQIREGLGKRKSESWCVTREIIIDPSARSSSTGRQAGVYRQSEHTEHIRVLQWRSNVGNRSAAYEPTAERLVVALGQYKQGQDWGKQTTQWTEDTLGPTNNLCAGDLPGHTPSEDNAHCCASTFQHLRSFSFGCSNPYHTI